MTANACWWIPVPAPCHDYSGFNFDHYWETVIPQKIKQYAAAGYL